VDPQVSRGHAVGSGGDVVSAAEEQLEKAVKGVKRRVEPPT